MIDIRLSLGHTVSYCMSFFTLRSASEIQRDRRYGLLLGGIVIAQGLLAVLVAILLFYRSGIYFLDAGYYVYTLASQNFGSQPPAIGGAAGTSLFDTHMLLTPLLISQFFRLLVSAPMNFIMYLGLQHTVLAIAGALLMLLASLQHGVKRSRSWVPMILGALLLPFSNIGLGSLLYPHVEVMGTSLVTIGVLLLVLRWDGNKSRWLLCAAVGATFLGLLTRQDIGAHLLITVVSACVCTQWRTIERHRIKSVMYLFLSGFIVSLILTSYQQIFFGEHDVFSVSYSGDPAYAHITSVWYVIDRILYLFASRLDLVVALGAFVMAAMVFRKRELLAFPLAVIPWILLNLTAIDPAKNAMGIYHLFPIILYATAPILATSLSTKTDTSAQRIEHGRIATSVTYGVAILSLFLGGVSAPPNGFGYLFTNTLRLPLISPSEISATHQAIEDFAKDTPRIAVDNAVMSIRPVILKDVPLIPKVQNALDIDAVMFFARYTLDQKSRQSIFQIWIADNRLISIRCLPGGLVQADASERIANTTNQTDVDLMAMAQKCHPQPGM
jgi:hypothetical protein